MFFTPYKARFLFALLFLVGVAFHARAEVSVSKAFSTDIFQQLVDIGAGKYWILPLRSGETGGTYDVHVELGNVVYKDISAFIVDEANLALFRQRLTYQSAGKQKGIAPYAFRYTIGDVGKYFLVIDNSHALLINKRVAVGVKLTSSLPDGAVNMMKSQFEEIYAGLKQQLVFPDFNINVRPCGQANAFSAHTNGDILLCTEMISRLASRPGALQGVFLHEVGHTLLNIWGLPGGDNEDIADEFASVVLLQKQDGGRAFAEYVSSFDGGNSRREAEVIIRNGDRHSLSIQRIRNIREHAIHANALFQRWNRLLYPHMTEDVLRQIVDKPSAYADAALARAELARRPSQSAEAVTRRFDKQSLVPLANSTVGGCAKDIECKGDRICENGVCVPPAMAGKGIGKK